MCPWEPWWYVKPNLTPTAFSYDYTVRTFQIYSTIQNSFFFWHTHPHLFRGLPLQFPPSYRVIIPDTCVSWGWGSLGLHVHKMKWSMSSHKCLHVQISVWDRQTLTAMCYSCRQGGTRFSIKWQLFGDQFVRNGACLSTVYFRPPALLEMIRVVFFTIYHMTQ